MSTAFQKFCVPRSARASYTCRRSLKTGGRYARCRSHISRPFSCRCKQGRIASRALVCPVSRADRYNTLHFASQSRVPKGTPPPLDTPVIFSSAHVDCKAQPTCMASKMQTEVAPHTLSGTQRRLCLLAARSGLFVLLSIIVKWFSLERVSDTSPSTTA